MILADENIHAYIVKHLREAGFEVVSVTEISKGVQRNRWLSCVSFENPGVN